MSTLAPASHAARTDLLTFSSRVARLAPDGLIRLKNERDRTTAWALAVGVLVRRDFGANLEGADDVTVSAKALADAVDRSVSSSEVVDLPEAMDAAWRASLPPSTDWTHREDLPATEILQTLDLAGSQLKALDDTQIAAAGDAMLSQTIAMVDRDSVEPVEIPMRMLVAMSRLGFLSEAGGENDTIRVATNGRWIVAATRLGAAFRRPASIDLLGLS
ncbi:hypothetical protein [Blastococcus sp. Marseille-P5729]|uniref:hypothetical protein n=1 Tax=Blastococcus sp. Marseille-P5729 TaxID=2086582 RepID=UPI000D0E5450|nr:hypothetical protein [Blastococcus sp. Marseille-P5729]